METLLRFVFMAERGQRRISHKAGCHFQTIQNIIEQLSSWVTNEIMIKNEVLFCPLASAHVQQNFDLSLLMHLGRTHRGNFCKCLWFSFNKSLSRTRSGRQKNLHNKLYCPYNFYRSATFFVGHILSLLLTQELPEHLSRTLICFRVMCTTAQHSSSFEIVQTSISPVKYSVHMIGYEGAESINSP